MNNDNRKLYPVIGVGAVVIYNAKVLLVQRARPPFQGQWCIPGGKVKYGETLQQAAEREIFEETGLIIRAGEPVYSFEIIEQGGASIAGDKSQNSDEGKAKSSVTEFHGFHYVVIDLEAEFVSGELNPGSDVQDASWFNKTEIMRPDIQEHTRRFLQNWWIEK